MSAEQIDTTHNAGLGAWLSTKILGARDVVVSGLEEAKAAGASAETMFLNAIWRQGTRPTTNSFVVRRQILGHDLLHQPELSYQARVMAAVSKQACLAAPAPAVIGVEEDPSLLGAPFLVMGRLPGQIVPQNPNYNTTGWLFDLPPERRGKVWENGIRALASVHRIDANEDFAFMSRGKARGLGGYVEWISDWLTWAVAGRDYPIGRAAIDYLAQQRPANAPTQVVWGDSIPANMLFGDDGSVTGLIDWELAALGPGEIDLAWWMMFDDLFSINSNVPRLEGLPDRERMIAVYEQAAGRRVSEMAYYEILVRLRMAIITMRAVDRKVAQGRYKADNDAWSHNPFTMELAQRLGLPAITPGPDFYEFAAMSLAK